MALPAVPFVGMPVLYRDPANPTQPSPGTVTLIGAGADGYLVSIVLVTSVEAIPNVPWSMSDSGQPGSCFPNPYFPWN